jgi:hypothetical protein
MFGLNLPQSNLIRHFAAIQIERWTSPKGECDVLLSSSAPLSAHGNLKFIQRAPGRNYLHAVGIGVGRIPCLMKGIGYEWVPYVSSGMPAPWWASRCDVHRLETKPYLSLGV